MSCCTPSLSLFCFMGSQFSSLPPVRVVFAVTMEGSARKVITVRSALMVRNKLEIPMELRLDSPSAPDSKCVRSFKAGFPDLLEPAGAFGVVTQHGGDSHEEEEEELVLYPHFTPWKGRRVWAEEGTEGESCSDDHIGTSRLVTEPVVLPSVMPGDSFAIPLHLTSWRLQARPKGMGVFFCKSPIHWTNVQKASEVSSSKRECHAMESENSRFFR